MIRSDSLSPYTGARYSPQLLEQFTHVVTLYLPPDVSDYHWRSEQYSARIENAIMRWSPSLVLSSEFDLTTFNIKHEGLTVRNVKPIGSSAIAHELFTRLHAFLKLTGIGDMKFYLLYRPEYGPLYDDIAKEAGFKNLVAIPVQTMGNLRKALSSIPSESNVAIINALTHVDNLEFGSVVLSKEIAKMVRSKGVLDLSVVGAANAAISVTHEAPVIDLSMDQVRGGAVSLIVSPRRLAQLGLREVYVVGFYEINGITR